MNSSSRAMLWAMAVATAISLLGGFALGVIAGAEDDRTRVTRLCDEVPQEAWLRLVWERRTPDGFDWVTDDQCAYYPQEHSASIEILERP